MNKEKIFLASEEVAQMLGVEKSRYRTAEGKYILSEHDIRTLCIGKDMDEFVNGIDAKVISEAKARELIIKSTLGSLNKNKEV